MNDDTNKTAETEAETPASGQSAPATVDALKATQAQVDAHESVLHRLIDQVEGLAQSGLRVAETGVAGTTAEAGAGIVQEIVDFLHRLFPGHGAPGIPTQPKPAD